MMALLLEFLAVLEAGHRESAECMQPCYKGAEPLTEHHTSISEQRYAHLDGSQVLLLLRWGLVHKAQPVGVARVGGVQNV